MTIEKVYSMTGYAQAARSVVLGQTESHEPREARLTLELKSVNNRFLDLSFRLPEALRALEPLLRDAIKAAVQRGKVECRAQWGAADQAQALLEQGLAQSLLQAQEALQRHHPQLQGLSVFELITLARQLAPGEADDAAALALREAMQATLHDAIEALLAMRAREGEQLRQTLLAQCAGIETLVESARGSVNSARQQQNSEFVRRWREALSLVGNSNGEAGGATQANNTLEQRLVAELAAFAVKTDIEEELARLSAHVHAVRETLRRGGAVGKRLDFLAQELAREANTFSAKASTMELSNIALELKVIVEQMREQVQNLE